MSQISLTCWRLSVCLGKRSCCLSRRQTLLLPLGHQAASAGLSADTAAAADPVFSLLFQASALP